jgi:hypothetical protein
MSRHATNLRREERTSSSHDSSDSDADTVERFAFKNGISRSQAYLEIRAGRLIARKVGTRTIITREDGAAWRSALPRLIPAGQEAAS